MNTCRTRVKLARAANIVSIYYFILLIRERNENEYQSLINNYNQTASKIENLELHTYSQMHVYLSYFSSKKKWYK